MSNIYQDALTAVLKEERALLLKGTFGELEGIVTRKEAALDNLGRLNASEYASALPSIRIKLQENARLLEAAMLGFEQAATRLEDIRSAIGQLKTYDGQGKVSSNNTAGPSVSFKA